MCSLDGETSTRLSEADLATANHLVAELESAGLLREVTGGKRRRMFRYEPYLDLWRDRPAPEPTGTVDA
jgi:hypothetical protein